MCIFPWALLHFQQYAIVLSHLNEQGGRAYKQAVAGKPSATGDVNYIDMGIVIAVVRLHVHGNNITHVLAFK